jgi:A/G-specific adenine glycosylase
MEDKLKVFRNSLLTWSGRHFRLYPWRKTFEPYRICVAEIMLQQTFAQKVVSVYEAFIRQYPSIKALSSARIQTLEKIIYPLGLLCRARRLKKMAKAVMIEHNGIMPKSKAALLSLPGVGNYVASAVMCFAYDQQVPIIDVNVVRVYCRYFGLKKSCPNPVLSDEIAKLATNILPKGKARKFNYATLDYASLVCSYYNPKCIKCMLNSNCTYYSL